VSTVLHKLTCILGKDPRELVDQTDNPGDISGNTAEGKTPERTLGKGTPSESPKDDANPSVIYVPDHTDKRADVDPESGLATCSDKTPIIVGPAPKEPEGGVPAAHPTFGSVEQSNDILSPCGPDEPGSTGNASPPGGNSATATDAEGVEKIDPESSDLGDPGSSILIPQKESSEDASDGPLSSGALVLARPATDACVPSADEPNAETVSGRAGQELDATKDTGTRILNLERPAADVCVTSPDEPNAEIISENAHQELDATKDIPNKRESESIADSPGKTELSFHGSKPAGVGSVDSPRFLDGGGRAVMDPEPPGRASASPRLSGGPHAPKAPEGTGTGAGGGSVHDFETAPKKRGPLLESSRDSDVSDSSYTSDISDISDAKVGKDTDTLEETYPIVNPKVDSKYLEEASPSLNIDILGTLKDNDAVKDVDPADGPKDCSEPPEKNIGSFESPPNPVQDSDLLEAASDVDPADGPKDCSEPPAKSIGSFESPLNPAREPDLLEATSDVEPSEGNDRVNSLDADSGSLLDEELHPIQPTDSNSLETVDGSGSIEELDPICNPDTGTDPESPEGVNAPQTRSADIGDPEALGNPENTASASDPEAGSKPSKEESLALESPQPSGVSKVAWTTDSAQQINKTDTLRAGPDSPEEIVLAAVSSQDSTAPVAENITRSGASVLDGGATDATSTNGGPSQEDAVSAKLPPSPATENTPQDAAPEGGSVLKDIGNLEIVDLEGANDIFVDTEEFRVPGAQRRQKSKDSDPENLPVVELQTGGVPLPDPLGLTPGDDQGISSNDSIGISITAEGLANVPRTPSTVSIAISLRKGDSGEFFDSCSDTSENNLDSTETTEFLGTRDKTALSEPLDMPHSHQVDLLRSPKITTPGQSAPAKINENFDPSGIACKKEESTQPQPHVLAAKSDADPQKGTQEADEAEAQKMEMESAGYFTAAVPPPTSQPDWHVPECSKCRQAAVLGHSGQGPDEYAPAGNPKSLEDEGSPPSKVNRALSTPSQVIKC